MFICWAIFKVKGLCPVLNKSVFFLMFVHTCITKCAWKWNVRYIYIYIYAAVGGWGGILSCCLSLIDCMWSAWTVSPTANSFIPFLKMYLWWSLCTFYWLARQEWVTIGASGLCCVCVMSFEPYCLTCLLIFLSDKLPWDWEQTHFRIGNRQTLTSPLDRVRHLLAIQQALFSICSSLQNCLHA